MSPLANIERDMAGLPAGLPPTFTGRERELASLARALGGPPAVVLVEGEAGIGKSPPAPRFLRPGVLA